MYNERLSTLIDFEFGVATPWQEGSIVCEGLLQPCEPHSAESINILYGCSSAPLENERIDLCNTLHDLRDNQHYLSLIHISEPTRPY